MSKPASDSEASDRPGPPPGPEGNDAPGARKEGRAAAPSGAPKDERPSAPPEEGDRRADPRLERLIPELFRRAVDAGIGRLSEAKLRQHLGRLEVPKEAIGVALSQIDETKQGLYRAVAKEVRDFLGNTNFSDELTQVLTRLSFEIKTEVRFVPNDSAPRPRVNSSVKVKHADAPDGAPAPDPSPNQDDPEPVADSRPDAAEAAPEEKLSENEA